jgi:hypothetical protein
MSQANIKRQRTIDERVGTRWASVPQRTMRSVLRLPLGSPVRRAMLRRWARVAFLAWNRGDFALVPNIDDPEVETRLTVRGQVAAGLDEVYYGPEGHCRVMAIWNEVWPKWDAEIDKIIEEGHDQVLIVARVHGEAAATGIRLNAWSAARYTFREGLILRVEGTIDPDRAKALAAVGLSE